MAHNIGRSILLSINTTLTLRPLLSCLGVFLSCLCLHKMLTKKPIKTHRVSSLALPTATLQTPFLSVLPELVDHQQLFCVFHAMQTASGVGLATTICRKWTARRIHDRTCAASSLVTLVDLSGPTATVSAREEHPTGLCQCVSWKRIAD